MAIAMTTLHSSKNSRGSLWVPELAPAPIAPRTSPNDRRGDETIEGLMKDRSADDVVFTLFAQNQPCSIESSDRRPGFVAGDVRYGKDAIIMVIVWL